MSQEDIEIELKKTHKIQAYHTIYWYFKCNIFIQHLEYRGCNKEECVKYHYDIIDLNIDDDIIITKLTQNTNKKVLLKYYIFSNDKFRKELKSHQMSYIIRRGLI